MKTRTRAALAALPFLLAVACTDAAKAPAEAAMAAASAAVESLKGDAERYAPEATQAVRNALDAAKERIASRDYEGALAAAKAIPDRARAALAVAEAKKAEIAKAWSDLADESGKMIANIRERAAALAKVHKLPPGVEKEAVAKANEAAAEIEAGWKKVSERVAAGDQAGAMALAKDLTARGQAVLKSLGI